MRLFLSLLLAGCATTPETQQFNELTFLDSPFEAHQEMAVLENEPELAEAEEPNVFLPGDINFERPERPEVEIEEPDPAPTLSTVQTALGWYGVNGIAISHDGVTGMLGMSGGNSCEYNPGGFLSGADFSNQSCPDIPVEYDEQGRVMFLCDDDIGFWSPSYGDQHYVVPGLVAAKVTADGFVTVEDADVCQVSRRDHAGGVASVEVPSDLCTNEPMISVNEDETTLSILQMAMFTRWSVMAIVGSLTTQATWLPLTQPTTPLWSLGKATRLLARLTTQDASYGVLKPMEPSMTLPLWVRPGRCSLLSTKTWLCPVLSWPFRRCPRHSLGRRYCLGWDV